MIMANIHTKAVRLMSQIVLAKAFIYFVMAFPEMLNRQVANIPSTMHVNRKGEANNSHKNWSGLSKNGIPESLKVQAPTPNGQGINVSIGKTTKYMAIPNIP